MQFLKKMKQRAAAATLVAVASALTLGMGAAHAEPTETGNMPTDPGTITIHKHKETPGLKDLKPDGSQQAPSDPLEGVEFSITKIEGLDLNKNEDWEKVKSLTVQKVQDRTDGISRGQVTKVTTDNKGVAPSPELPMGVYLVEETGVGNNAVTKKAAPFFVTIPLPFEGKWINEVHVYPKNVVQNPGQKNVSDDKDTHKVGDIIEWTITTYASSDNPKAYGVVDQLPTGLEYVAASAKVLINGKPVQATDITVDEKNDPKHHVKITLDEAARKGIKSGDVVLFVLKTRVASVPENGVVKNSAWPIDNDLNPFDDPNTNKDNPPIIPEKDPRFGDYSFQKVDAADPARPLQGAEFGLFECDGDNAKGTAIETATSDDKGTVSFKGIYLGTFEKNLAPKDTKKEFCLKETKAPAGYILNPEVKKIMIASGQYIADSGLDKVTNTQQEGPKLPLTGAAGTVLLTAAGLGLLGVGGALYLSSARSRKQR